MKYISMMLCKHVLTYIYILKETYRMLPFITTYQFVQLWRKSQC